MIHKFNDFAKMCTTIKDSSPPPASPSKPLGFNLSRTSHECLIQREMVYHVFHKLFNSISLHGSLTAVRQEVNILTDFKNATLRFQKKKTVILLYVIKDVKNLA